MEGETQAKASVAPEVETPALGRGRWQLVGRILRR